MKRRQRQGFGPAGREAMAKIRIPGITWLLFTFMMLSQSALPAAETTITVTKAQEGREIALTVGSVLQIELPGRGGTGYSWSAEETFAPYLKLLDQTSRQLKENLPGGPVMQIWRFKAEKPGVTEIRMAYYRPWEGVGTAKDHFRVKLHIN
jgi:predicted secreted protein